MKDEKMNNDEVLIVKQKTQFFYNSQIPVHVTYKNSASWKNGTIKDMSADFFMLDEREEGLIPIFFLEIKNIEEYEKVDKHG